MAKYVGMEFSIPISFFLTLELFSYGMCFTREVRTDQNIVLVKTQMDNCTSEVFRNVSILDIVFERGRSNTSIQCVSACISIPDCQNVIRLVPLNGLVKCVLLKHDNLGNVTAEQLEMSQYEKCLMLPVEKICPSPQVVVHGECVCQDAQCSMTKLTYKDPEWVKIVEVKNGTLDTIFNMSMFADSAYYYQKVAFRDDSLGVDVVMKRLYSRLLASDCRIVITNEFMMKASWNSYAPSPTRSILYFIADGRTQLLTMNGTQGIYQLTENVVQDFTIISSAQEIYNVQVDDNITNYGNMKEMLESGYEIMDAETVGVFGEPDMVFMQTSTKLASKTTGFLRNTPTWYNSKNFLGPGRSVVRPIFGVGDYQAILNYPNWLDDIRLNPGWSTVPDFAGNVGGLIEILKLGYSVRIKVGSVYHNVLEAIKTQNDVTFVLAPYMEHVDMTVYEDTNLPNGIKALVKTSGELESCNQVMESNTVTGWNQTSGNQITWFVDTRKWTEVYAVFSNSSVAYGSLTALALHVREGKDVRVWIQWLNIDKARYLDTHMSLVTDSGQVSTESVLTWATTDLNSLNVTLSPQCGYQAILVSSDGRVEVLSFNIWTPGTAEVINDVMITWFTN